MDTVTDAKVFLSKTYQNLPNIKLSIVTALIETIQSVNS